MIRRGEKSPRRVGGPAGGRQVKILTVRTQLLYHGKVQFARG